MISEKAKAIRKDLGIREDALVFGFVGRIVGDKGINELVRAFRALQFEQLEIHLVLVGHFEDELDPVDADIRTSIENHPRIHAVGFQSDIRPYLELSDVFTFPSYREGFPNVVLQAACYNLPLIVTDINGCNEIVENDITGLIIPPKDESELGHAMQRLALHADQRERLGQAARRYVVENYSQAAYWQALLDEYNLLPK